MKWGVRRYQNKDGSLTPAGKKRYSDGDDSGTSKLRDYEETKAAYKTAKKAYSKSFNKAYNKAASAYSPFKKHRQANDARWTDAIEKGRNADAAKKAYKMAKKEYKKDYKDFVKTRSKEILAGESFIARSWDRLTDAHKRQAEIEYHINERAKFDERYRD